MKRIAALKSSSFYSEGIAQGNSFVQEDCNFSLLKGQQAVSVIPTSEEFTDFFKIVNILSLRKFPVDFYYIFSK